MDIDPLPWKLITLFIGLFPFSMLFSSAETALMSLSDSELTKLRESGNSNQIQCYKLATENSDLLLITLLLGNVLVNTSIPTIAALITKQLLFNTILEHWALVIEIGVVGSLLLLLGEIVPKSMAINNSYAYVKRYFKIIYFFYIALYPFTYFIFFLVRLVTNKISHFRGISTLSEKEIRKLVEVGNEDGALKDDEKDMINSVISFGDTSAKEIMIPRVDIQAARDDLSFDELLTFIKDTTYSRLPVYNESIDNITGILYIKDVLNYLSKDTESLTVADLVREVHYVPESKDIGDLLKLFQKEKIHISVVVDEYGGTAGIITLEDIIEEIVGEIQDEFDNEEKLFDKHSDNIFILNAKMSVIDVNELLEINLPEDEDYESLGGFLLDLFGKVPDQGDKISYKNLEFEILSLKKRRIGRVRIEKTLELE